MLPSVCARRALLYALSLALLSAGASADPCGMVPPVFAGNGPPITRIGLQKTYVFYKDGVESIVLRPGFSGKVEQFGMLIPFPTPPALRKLPDDIFAQLAAAVDPPEVQLWPSMPMVQRGLAFGAVAESGDPGLELNKNEVRVLHEEALGMYEVAVLEAGSAAALKRWMDDHGFRYPDGMDVVCEEYVAEKWCFVAVKARVGKKSGVDPRPGMRDADPALAPGEGFDGHVQAMGFRFKTPELVVPMRLSAFNEGELRNVVYVLTDGPRKIADIPEELVVRQIPGELLFRNVTGPLPVRLMHGSLDDCTLGQLRNLAKDRDPAARNGMARILFASDLAAVSQGRLSHPHEEAEKGLLSIGEHLSLRGASIDALHQRVLAEQAHKHTDEALKALEGMTLSVIDGDFPREVLARQNLRFDAYAMPAGKNTAMAYTATSYAPGFEVGGTLLTEADLEAMHGDLQKALGGDEDEQNQVHWQSMWTLPLCLLVALVGLRYLRRSRGAAAAALLMLLTVPLLAQDVDVQSMLDKLAVPEHAADAAEALIEIGPKAVPHLIGEAAEGADLAARGWAIVCLTELGGEAAEACLKKLQDDAEQPELVRVWAAAGRVSLAEDATSLGDVMDLALTQPALIRPLMLRLGEQGTSGGSDLMLEKLLALTMQPIFIGYDPNVWDPSGSPIEGALGEAEKKAVNDAIVGFPAAALGRIMVRSADMNVRYQATAYLGSKAGTDYDGVVEAVLTTYAFDAEAETVPWQGGPLYIPGIQWKKKPAQALVGRLLRWFLWCDLNGAADQSQQIVNNLASIGLADAAGYANPGWNYELDAWLLSWGRALGKKELLGMLAEQGVEEQARFVKLLKQL